MEKIPKPRPKPIVFAKEYDSGCKFEAVQGGFIMTMAGGIWCDDQEFHPRNGPALTKGATMIYDYQADDVIAVCHICGGELTRADDEASLIIWVHPPDYNVTGVKEPYCRGCAEDAAQHPLI